MCACARERERERERESSDISSLTDNSGLLPFSGCACSTSFLIFMGCRRMSCTLNLQSFQVSELSSGRPKIRLFLRFWFSRPFWIPVYRQGLAAVQYLMEDLVSSRTGHQCCWRVFPECCSFDNWEWGRVNSGRGEELRSDINWYEKYPVYYTACLM